MHNAYIIELTAKFVAIVPKIMSIYLILVLYIAFYYLQNSIVSSPKMQEMAFQRLLISKFCREACPRTAYECVVNVRPIGHPWLRHLTEQLTLRTTESLHPAPPPYPSLGNIYRNR